MLRLLVAALLVAATAQAQNTATRQLCQYQNADHTEALAGDRDDGYNDLAQYVRLYLQNDFFKLHGLTDRYYTNGFKLDYFFGKQLLHKAFLTVKSSPTSNHNFGLTAGMDMYTPADIKAPAIQAGDRPYAGYAYLGIKCISQEFVTGERLTTEYTLGVLGAQARQQDVQTWVHERLDYAIPQGWQHQLRNEPTVSANLQYERLLVNPEDNLEAVGGMEVNVGTVMNYAALGATIRIGAFNDYFLNESGFRTAPEKTGPEKARRYIRQSMARGGRRFYCRNLHRRWQAFVFVKPSVRLVLTNSLLQGGVFTYKDCPYTLPSDSLSRVVGGAEFGGTLTSGRFALSYSQQFRSPEFTGARTAQWGALALTVRFR